MITLEALGRHHWTDIEQEHKLLEYLQVTNELPMGEVWMALTYVLCTMGCLGRIWDSSGSY